MPCSLSVQGNYKNVLSASRSNGRKNEMTGEGGGMKCVTTRKKKSRKKERKKESEEQYLATAKTIWLQKFHIAYQKPNLAGKY